MSRGWRCLILGHQWWVAQWYGVSAPTEKISGRICKQCGLAEEFGTGRRYVIENLKKVSILP